MNKKEVSFTTLDFVPQKVVLKLGSAVLTRSGEERLDENLLDDVAQTVSRMFDEGREVILVSSGAVASGIGLLRHKTKPRSIPEKQAFAAVGQGQLMHLYSVHFSRYGRNIAQLLLTRDDMEDRRRYLNTSYTLEKILSYGVVPIINENDTTTVDELRFGDNDLLSAIVAAKMKAELLIILSDVDGLFDKDPRQHPDARLIPQVKQITPEIESVAAHTPSRLGAGGMRSKIDAARRATHAGAHVCICNGKRPGILNDLFAGRCIGTLFLPQKGKDLSSRERWIAFGKVGINRWIIVDDGAKKALIQGKKSLLPVGVKDIKGEFEQGDVVEIRDTKGERLGKGLVNFNSSDILKIKGAKSEAIEKILGQKEYDEVIHRDNMIIFSS
jgi:glutamate 5-kinase